MHQKSFVDINNDFVNKNARIPLIKRLLELL